MFLVTLIWHQHLQLRICADNITNSVCNKVRKIICWKYWSGAGCLPFAKKTQQLHIRIFDAKKPKHGHKRGQILNNKNLCFVIVVNGLAFVCLSVNWNLKAVHFSVHYRNTYYRVHDSIMAVVLVYKLLCMDYFFVFRVLYHMAIL